MRILLIHQNFPGWYKHLSPALVARGDGAYALMPKVQNLTMWKGLKVIRYKINRRSCKEQILRLLILRQKLYE